MCCFPLSRFAPLRRAVKATACTALLFAAVSCQAQPPIPTPAPPALPVPPPLWTDAEKAKIVAYWAEPGRYTLSSPPDVATKGVWQVRLTPEGSTWLLAYQRAVSGPGKIAPTQDAKPSNDGPHADWENWISARLACDRFQAEQDASMANKPLLAPSAPLPALPTLATLPIAPKNPGPIPASLAAACGNPPPLAGIYAPLTYSITIGEPALAETYLYTDNVQMRPRFAYYRFSKGVNSNGTPVSKISQAERDNLFRAASLTPSDQRIFEAISPLEGGFDAVQTYDTGFLSVGFIQFVTLAEGKHDLSNVLQTEKTEQPTEFASDFHNFGIDVQPDLTLTIVDPQTGVELHGPEAVLKIIDDKRLVAVFQRACRRTPFRVAQIKIAKSYYWPTGDPVTIALPKDSRLAATVGDIVHSEAGLATLLDRKINTGNIRPFSDVVNRVCTAHKVKSVEEAAKYEKEIIAAMKYRTDFLADKTLGQPK